MKKTSICPNARCELRSSLGYCSYSGGCVYQNLEITSAIHEFKRFPAIGGWISVKDRLPDTYKTVITYDKKSGVKENWLLRTTPNVSWSQGFHVTHWMPMPEPPKEE